MFWRKALVCSFCHRSECEVEKLVSGPRILFVGPRVFICDRCTAIVVRIMAQGGSDGDRVTP